MSADRSVIPMSMQTVQFVMIDTMTLTGARLPLARRPPPCRRRGAVASRRRPPFHAAGGIPGEWDAAFSDELEQPPVDEEQWSWLEKTLNSSTADWIIVARATDTAAPEPPGGAAQAGNAAPAHPLGGVLLRWATFRSTASARTGRRRCWCSVCCR